jgi:hypothetical protein
MASYTSPIPIIQDGGDGCSRFSIQGFHKILSRSGAGGACERDRHDARQPLQPQHDAGACCFSTTFAAIDYLKRDAEARQAMSGEGSQGWAAPTAPAAKDGPAKPRVASGEKAAPRPRPKVQKALDPLPLGPDIASPPAAESPPVAAGLIAEGSNMASAVGDFVVAAWQYPGRALPKLSLADLPAAPWPFAGADSAFRSRSDAARR